MARREGLKGFEANRSTTSDSSHVTCDHRGWVYSCEKEPDLYSILRPLENVRLLAGAAVVGEGSQRTDVCRKLAVPPPAPLRELGHHPVRSNYSLGIPKPQTCHSPAK